jgi:hypothetical protein
MILSVNFESMSLILMYQKASLNRGKLQGRESSQALSRWPLSVASQVPFLKHVFNFCG